MVRNVKIKNKMKYRYFQKYILVKQIRFINNGGLIVVSDRQNQITLRNLN